MNQQHLITALKAKGYTVALAAKDYSVMTRPVGAEFTGQVVHLDGTILTLKSVDAVRAINHEEINMSTYYTEKQINDMTEAERTALYNERTGSSVARMRNKQKAVKAILDTNPAMKVSSQHADAVKQEEQDAVAAEKPAKKKSIKLQVREILLDPEVTNVTTAQLMEQSKGTKSSVQTALSDLKSDKYAGAGGKLNIMKTKNEAGEPAFTIHL